MRLRTYKHIVALSFLFITIQLYANPLRFLMQRQKALSPLLKLLAKNNNTPKPFAFNAEYLRGYRDGTQHSKESIFDQAFQLGKSSGKFVGFLEASAVAALLYAGVKLKEKITNDE